MLPANDVHIFIGSEPVAEVVKWGRELELNGCIVTPAADGETLTQAVAQGQGHILLNCPHYPDEAVEVVSHLRGMGYEGEIIVVTTSPSISEAVALMALGCHDYLPASLCAEKVTQRMLEAVCHLPPSAPRFELLWKSFRKRVGWEHVHTASPACRAAYTLAAQASQSDVTVLVEGDTGTGKEYLARALHYMSLRRDKPFVAVNCGAIPETLLESELFGHDRGAFTSATREKPGLCETAHRGTLFLDEIGDMSLAMQVKLLRFLQERSFVRLGGLETRKVDVRIVAATNQDLHRAVREGRFREDLYYRLAVINIQLPPLCRRTEDILMFAGHFLRKHASSLGTKHLCEYAERELLRHTWPGNLRELENVIQRAMLTSPYRTIHADCIATRPTAVSSLQQTLHLVPAAVGT